MKRLAGVELFCIVAWAAVAAFAGTPTEQGWEALNNRDPVAAKALFEQALTEAPDAPDPNFGMAIAEAILLVNNRSEALQQLLRDFGIGPDDFTVWTLDALTRPKDIPGDAPKPSQVQQVIKSDLLPQFDDVIAHLAKIKDSPGYEKSLSSAILSNDPPEQIEIDMAEVRAGLGAARVVRALVNTLLAYKLDVDYAQISAAQFDFQAYLDDTENPESSQLFTLQDDWATLLHSAHADLVNAGEDARASIQAAHARAGSSEGHPVTISPDDVPMALARTDEFRSALQQDTDIMEDPQDVEKGVFERVNLKSLFYAPIDRTVLPRFHVTDPAATEWHSKPVEMTFPKPTLNGTLPLMTNEELSGIVCRDHIDLIAVPSVDPSTARVFFMPHKVYGDLTAFRIYRTAITPCNRSGEVRGTVPTEPPDPDTTWPVVPVEFDDVIGPHDETTSYFYRVYGVYSTGTVTRSQQKKFGIPHALSRSPLDGPAGTVITVSLSGVERSLLFGYWGDGSARFDMGGTDVWPAYWWGDGGYDDTRNELYLEAPAGSDGGDIILRPYHCAPLSAGHFTVTHPDTIFVDDDNWDYYYSGGMANGTPGFPYPDLWSAANLAQAGNTIRVSDGTYWGCWPAVPLKFIGNGESTVIEGSIGLVDLGGRSRIEGLRFVTQETSIYCGNSLADIVGNTFTGVYYRRGCLVSISGGPLGQRTKVSNCVFARNALDEGVAVAVNGEADILNSAFVGNSCPNGAAVWFAPDAKGSVRNCIFWNNEGDDVWGAEAGIVAEYCYVSSDPTGTNIGPPQYPDPLFADEAAGDYHLKSKGGRWNPATGRCTVRDAVHSPCIDAGDRNSAWDQEPWPNGSRINLGAYGNTPQASKLFPNPDISGDDCVNVTDLLMVRNQLGKCGSQIAPPWVDVNGDGCVNVTDLLIVRNTLSKGSGCNPAPLP